MLRPEPMTKVVVIGLRNDLQKVVDSLHSLGVVHIAQQPEGLEIGSPLEEAEVLSEAAVRLEAAMSALGIKKTGAVIDLTASLKALLKKANDAAARISSLQDKEASLKEELKSASDRLALLRVLKQFSLDPGDLSVSLRFSLLIGHAKNPKHIPEIKKHEKAFVQEKAIGGKTYVAVLYPEEEREKISELISASGIMPLNFSHLEGARGSTKDLIEKTEKSILSIRKELSQLAKEKERIRSKEAGFMVSAMRRLEIELERANAPLRFGVTERAFLLTGFVPTRSLLTLQKKLSEATNGRITIQIEKPAKKEPIPVKLKNPNPVRPFEFFMRLYTLPDYREIDPTFLTFLTFPFFFGFMLGDMGYGLVTLILFLWLRKKVPAARELATILAWASVFTIIAGAFFGEFFGLESVFGYELPHLLSRAHQQMDLLKLSILLGAVHVNIGLIVGFVNVLHHHGLKMAILEKASWFVLQAGVVLLALKSTGAGAALLALSVVMLYMGEGFKGIIELPSIFGNILSYARLMALGLASLSLAEIVNEFAHEFISSGSVGGIVSAILIVVLGHVINIALGILGPFLHSLRLHYVELFSKFFKGGGIPYRPFGADIKPQTEGG